MPATLAAPPAKLALTRRRATFSECIVKFNVTHRTRFRRLTAELNRITEEIYAAESDRDLVNLCEVIDAHPELVGSSYLEQLAAARVLIESAIDRLDRGY